MDIDTETDLDAETPATREDPVLSVERITKRFGSNVAVAELDFWVHAGEVVGLLGPNGSGKTTTLHMIVDLLQPNTGRITIDGEPPNLASVRRRIGIVPDDLPLPSALTGTEFLDLHKQLRGAADPAICRDMVEMFDLGPHLNRSVGAYSHGMKRKLQLVAAVAHRPRLLILDEPHRGLDPESVVIVRELIEMLRAGGQTAILIATHDLGRAEREIDRVVIMSHGRRLAFDTPTAVATMAMCPDLESAFLRLTGLDVAVIEARQRLSSMLGTVTSGVSTHPSTQTSAHTSAHLEAESERSDFALTDHLSATSINRPLLEKEILS